MIQPETARDILGNFAKADFHTLRASEVFENSNHWGG